MTDPAADPPAWAQTELWLEESRAGRRDVVDAPPSWDGPSPAPPGTDTTPPPVDLDAPAGDEDPPPDPAAHPGDDHPAPADEDDPPPHDDSGATDFGPPAPQASPGDDLPTVDPADQPDPAVDPTPDPPAAAPDPADDPAPDADASEPPPRYDKKIAAVFVAATAAAALLASGGMLAMRTSPHTDQDHASQPGTRVSIAAAPTSTSVTGEHDSTLPYTATSVGCLPGSTAAQVVAGSDPTQAWICVTGGNLGQYVVINLGRTMLITAVSLTPGWLGSDKSGTDQWHQHRVLTRVQWSFNDSPPTVVAHDTGSVHGEATKAIPERGVLASRITLLVQETARAPADTAPTTSAAPGGLFGDILGPPATSEPPSGATAAPPSLPGDPRPTDPADNSFAVSSIKVFGHPPQ